MNRQNPQESWFDRLAARELEHFAQASSRRGLLAWCGKLALAALGVTAVRILPLDRSVPQAEAASCTDWSLQGLWGRICTCCNGGNPLQYCPAGSQLFSFWQRCVYNSTEHQFFWINYWDCCNSSANCSSCLACYNNSGVSKSVWCNGGVYNCTAVAVTSVC